MSAPIMHVVAARPNFIKMASVIRALRDTTSVNQMVVHTGQHYDASMSGRIQADLDLPAPDVHLDVGSGTHGEQTGRTLIKFERLLLAERPELVVVAGDVNATLACALAATKLQIPVAHVESGLRSFDWAMPEEINRVLTDRISTLLFTHSPEAGRNLADEGIDSNSVHLVGNTMIDSLADAVQEAAERKAWEAFGVQAHAYVLVTLHRPSNVDDHAQLARIVASLEELAESTPIVFPMHPRTARLLESNGLRGRLAAAGVRCCGPLGYTDFLSLEVGAGAVLTDSGGVQEETSVLGVRCYTLRANTERPITLTQGTNELIGSDATAITRIRPTHRPPVRRDIPLWDGRAGERIARVITGFLAHVPAAEVAWTV
jgi:UDP-N-acetylglucosamine 2-epimerase (non-hydrolysing)